jgi:O-acetylhomoserine (thiol)-lyase
MPIKDIERPLGFNTRALHTGYDPDSATHARAVPIYQTTSFTFENSQDAADLFALKKFGNIYTRIMNPTTAVLEERVASLEGGVAALAVSSGQAAQFLTVSTIAAPGDHIVASSTLYGGTFTQFDVTLRRLGYDFTFVEPDDPENFRKAITPKTRMIYGETISTEPMLFFTRSPSSWEAMVPPLAASLWTAANSPGTTASFSTSLSPRTPITA